MKAVTVTVASGDRLTAAIGSATFPAVQGTVSLTGKVYVPGLHKNLMSAPKLIEKGLSLKMLKHKCIVESKRGPVIAIPKSGSLYITECLMVVTDRLASETVTMIDKKFTFAVASDATNSWHQRFGYLGTKAIVAMSKKEIVLGISKLEEHKYESSLWPGCTLGKIDNAKEFKEYLSDQSTVLIEIRDYTPQLSVSAERNHTECHEHDEVYVQGR
jgi:hypothetical protein